jgi:hypothetical protein
MKRYKVRCGPNNDCTEPGGVGDACECDGSGNCTDWIVGFFNEQGLTGDALQTAFEASTDKFLGLLTKDGNLKLGEVGILAKAGLRSGDELVSIQGFTFKDASHRSRILNWQFETAGISIVYIRNDKQLTAMMGNPKRS